MVEQSDFVFAVRKEGQSEKGLRFSLVVLGLEVAMEIVS